MISQAIQDAINEQIKNELYSAYLYLSMSTYCNRMNLPGFAGWMRAQSSEEYNHAMKLLDYLEDQEAKVQLGAIDQPPSEFGSPLDVWQQTLDHERKVTGMINKLYALAQQENDYATQAMLQWFVSEQVEEERTASLILEQVKMVGASNAALFFIDRHVGKMRED
jgi:ferritin